MIVVNNNNALDELLTDKDDISFSKGSVVFRPEDELRYIYYLKSGWVRQYAISVEGEELTLNIYRPGSYFSIVLAFNQEINLHYFEAMTRLSIVKIPKQEFIDFMKVNPAVMFDLTKKISVGLSSLMSRMESLVFGTAINKVAANLYLNASRFGGESFKHNKDIHKPEIMNNTKKSIVIDFPLTHRQIATMSGLTRETVSIVMMKLKRQNIISYSRQEVVVLDIQRLYEISSLSQ